MASRSTHVKKSSPVPFYVSIAVILIVVVLGIFLFLNNSGSEDTRGLAQDEEPVFNFAFGITLGGEDISGLSREQAEARAETMVEKKLGTNIEFNVEGKDEPYEVSLSELGVTMDYSSAIDEAVTYTEFLLRQENDSKGDQSTAQLQARDFPLNYTYNSSEIQAALDALKESEDWGEEPNNYKYKVETESNEAELTTGGAFVETLPQDGYEIDTKAMAEMIEEQLDSGEFSSFEAPVETIPASGSGLDMEPQLLGSMETSFKTSSPERRYNIWKISEKLNGVVFKPNEVFSVNDYVGPRNAENGWKEGLGIEDGQYTPQYGGGICQVSTTMYNATVKAEMKMISRLPHTIPSSYVDRGMDATISTDGPDFKLMNELDTEMYMIVTCDNSKSTIKVDIYGYEERSYYLELYSKMISDPSEKVPPVEYVRNNELSSKAVQQLKEGQRKEQWQVYARKIDKETGKTIEEDIEITTSTYEAIAPVYEIGPDVPMPETGQRIPGVSSGSSSGSSGSSSSGSGSSSGGSSKPSDSSTGSGGESDSSSTPSDSGSSDSGGGSSPSDADSGGSPGGSDSGGSSGGNSGGSGSGSDTPPMPNVDFQPEDVVILE